MTKTRIVESCILKWFGLVLPLCTSVRGTVECSSIFNQHYLEDNPTTFEVFTIISKILISFYHFDPLYLFSLFMRQLYLTL